MDHSLKTVAFPFISAGAFGYPHEEAAGIALNTLVSFCESHPGALSELRVVLFGAGSLRVWEIVLDTGLPLQS